MSEKLKVGIVGASGYGGLELCRILLQHSKVAIQALYSSSKVGQSVSQLHPSLYGLLRHNFVSLERVGKDIDVLFISAPHGASMQIALKAFENNSTLKIIDIGADFRLALPLFEKVYGLSHESPELLEKSVYGAAELFPDEIREASLIANPGCFAHAITLAAAPLVSTGKHIRSLFVSGITGSTGSGVTPQPRTHHPERNESVSAYSPLNHRHVPEIEQTLAKLGGELKLHFVPHSGPFSRGIYATLFAEPEEDTGEVLEAYEEFSEKNFFIRSRKTPPRLCDVRGSNFVDLSVSINGGTLAVMVALDNLMKGAAGNAVQCMNLMSGFSPEEGLLFAPFVP